MKPVDLTGRTALITGGGSGLGLSHAKMLAGMGAQVVINDLGVDLAGGGNSPVAERAAQDIRDAGGQAVADMSNAATVEGVADMVRTAEGAFGQVDIVICNAGFLRDDYFHKAQMPDLEAVIGIHLMGPMYLARAVYPGMRARRFGRLVFTTSVSGLYGNIAQSAYAAGKAGVLGLMKTIAMEGASFGVYANAISPLAVSRMAGDLMPPLYQKTAKPEHVSAMVALLCAPGCTINGQTIAAGAGLFAATEQVEAKGIHLDPHAPITPDMLWPHLDAILDFSHPYLADHTAGSFERLTRGLQRGDFVKGVTDK